MLRSAVIALGIVCFAGGLVALLAGAGPPGFAAMSGGGLILLGTLWERFRYKTVEKGVPGPGWVCTDERFVDDETGKPVSVYLEPTTGERQYVQD